MRAPEQDRRRGCALHSLTWADDVAPHGGAFDMAASLNPFLSLIAPGWPQAMIWPRANRGVMAIIVSCHR
jgi:hypothetical protein